MNTKKDNNIRLANPDPGLGQAEKCDSVQLVDG
jgi:hypothetical protein